MPRVAATGDAVVHQLAKALFASLANDPVRIIKAAEQTVLLQSLLEAHGRVARDVLDAYLTEDEFYFKWWEKTLNVPPW